MKRSDVNIALQGAKDLLMQFRWALPEWAYWGDAEYAKNPKLVTYLRQHQMGWDVTDFGSERFLLHGLTLFCVRNGIQSDPDGMPYAEKLLFVGESQETPFHCHHVKMEDIINRGGGNLIVEFSRKDQNDKNNIQVSIDGRQETVALHAPLRLRPGQSVTMERGIYHRFYGEPGTGKVLAGEVSQVNDDGSDNDFIKTLDRFSAIEEDEPALHPLWNELGGA